MRYCQKSDEIRLTLHEMTAYSLAHYSGSRGREEEPLPLSEERRRSLGLPAEPLSFSHSFTVEGVNFCVEGEVFRREENGGVTLLFPIPVTTSPDSPPERVKQVARGEAFLAARIELEQSRHAPHLCFIYYNAERDQRLEVYENPKPEKLTAFFERAAYALRLCAKHEIGRVRERMPTMKKLPFPFSEARAGQEEFMHAAYKAAKRGGRLYACAPTGIGKTVSALYPAVRAMGEGAVEKIFYLTSKTTAARMAAKTVEQLGAGGALLGVQLTAKEKLCPYRTECHEELPCPLGAFRPGRIEEAAEHLLARGLPMVREAELCETARQFAVCPYELALHYSLLCDVILCDYNYLFDPKVRLRRFFSLPGEWCFLIDEAHNLADRVREMYAATLSLSAIEGLRQALAPTDRLGAPLVALADYFRSCLAPLISENEPASDAAAENSPIEEGILRSLPDGLLPLLYDCFFATEKQMYASKKSPIYRRVRRFYFDMKTILDILSCYDEGFRLSVTRRGRELSFRTLCIDPARVIDESLARGKSAVLFSATLHPTEYYRNLLGGDNTAMLLDIPSPFERENLCLAVLDKIGTRYTQRTESLPQVAEAVLVTYREKPGNYMVFCPSYAYMQALADAVNTALATSPTACERPRILIQGRGMSEEERERFLASFEESQTPTLGFCVMGGIYGEGIDLVGERLIGAVIVGVGFPYPDRLHQEIAKYYGDKYESGGEYAYVYPGMNQVLQAAGRVIRSETDRGVVVLIDDRFAMPAYRRILPDHWHGLRFAGDTRSLRALLHRFWEN